MDLHAQQKNYHFSHTDSTVAPSDKIWKIWTDVPNWNKWDKGLKEAFLEGEFMKGAQGKLIPDKGPQSKFIIDEVQLLKSYTFKTKIPFGWLIIKRSLETKNGKTFFAHEIKFTGILKRLLGKRLGKKYREMLPDVLNEIKNIAENQ